MNKQMNLSFFSDELKEVKTHKREFLEQIERIMPWGELEGWSDRATMRESAEISPTTWS